MAKLKKVAYMENMKAVFTEIISK